MICSKCNKKVGNENNFCPYCGKTLIIVSPTEEITNTTPLSE